MEEIIIKVCSSCSCYWKPDETDIKSSGDIFKSCKKCREKSKVIAVKEKQNIKNNPIKYLLLKTIRLIGKCFKKKTTITEKKQLIEYLGCSADKLFNYFQLKINNWNVDNPTRLMDFSNIHIDHIKPISRFNLDDPNDFLACCNYTNLQPLLIFDNCSKNNYWTDENEGYWNDNIKGNTEYNRVYYQPRHFLWYSQRQSIQSN